MRTPWSTAARFIIQMFGMQCALDAQAIASASLASITSNAELDSARWRTQSFLEDTHVSVDVSPKTHMRLHRAKEASLLQTAAVTNPLETITSEFQMLSQVVANEFEALHGDRQKDAATPKGVDPLGNQNQERHELAALPGPDGLVLRVLKVGESRHLEVARDGKTLLQSPSEGLWSVADGWKNQWPARWHHAVPTQVERKGAWLVLSGDMPIQDSVLQVRDVYRFVGRGAVEGIRRWKWTGKELLSPCSLSLRWTVPGTSNSLPLLPGIMYYGNPSGARNGEAYGVESVASLNAEDGGRAVFEEHRYPMPFASVELGPEGAALHTIPSPVPFGNARDQWWSLGVDSVGNKTELISLSGAVSMNGKPGMVKANAQRALPFDDAWLNLQPGAVVEKRFLLEAYAVAKPGDGFRTPVRTSLDLHDPSSTAGLPKVVDILRSKLEFASSRWHADDRPQPEGVSAAQLSLRSAGYQMFPRGYKIQLVMGWAGQAESGGYGSLVLGHKLGQHNLVERGQRTLDFLSSTPTDEAGFFVKYDAATGEWSGRDPVSQGQAMGTFARAIHFARKQDNVTTDRWEAFLQKACDVHAKRILADGWHPRSTAEGFLVAPLARAAKLFSSDGQTASLYASAARKAAEHYVKRHRSMTEPYWGGTLDASCEDKEGAWAAFQAFLAMYELTQEQAWLDHASHAMDATLTYTYAWDVDLPAGRLRDHGLKTRGWTGVSTQNQHLDVYGVLYAPELWRMGELLARPELQSLAEVMYRSCGQLIGYDGSQGEQVQQTNYAQQGNMDDVTSMRGGYVEDWTVFWITAHFLQAAAVLDEMGVLDRWVPEFRQSSSPT